MPQPLVTGITPGHDLYVIARRDHAYWIIGPFASRGELTSWENKELELTDAFRFHPVELPKGAQVFPTYRPSDFHPPLDRRG